MSAERHRPPDHLRIPRSRGADDTEIENALDVLTQRGLVTDGTVNADGVAYRQSLEDRTDELCIAAWRCVGEATTSRFLDIVEPVSQRFLDHIDRTAGDHWMPAARPRRR